jgi:hypothetical protein
VSKQGPEQQNFIESTPCPVQQNLQASDIKTQQVGNERFEQVALDHSAHTLILLFVSDVYTYLFF